jgi:hypothetical protein
MVPDSKTFFLPQERYDEVKKKYPHFNEPWTKEELNRLTDLAIQKCTQKEMSRQLGRSTKSIKLKLLERGLYVSRKKEGNDEDWFLSHMYWEQLSIQSMALYACMSESEVLLRLLRLNVAKKTVPEIPSFEDFDEEPNAG